MRRAYARSAGVLASAICALPLVSMANDEIPTTTLRASPSFSTRDVAAVAAVREAFARSTQYEYGGVLFKCGNLFSYSDPVTINQEQHLEFRVDVPGDCSIAGMYHTHPGMRGAPRSFSAADVHVATAYNIPSYIGIEVDRSMRIFLPTGDRSSRSGALRSGRGSLSSSGRVVDSSL